MPRRVCHMIKDEVFGTSMNFRTRTETYWCGKKEKFLVSPEPLTDEQQAELDAFTIEQEFDPWPVCKKCQSKKTKYREISDK